MNPILLKGKKVVGDEGYVLGEVDDLNIDWNTWQAAGFCVNLSNEAVAELGFKKSFMRKITVCLPTKLIKAVGDVVTLKEPIRKLKDIEEKEIAVNPNIIAGKKVFSAAGYAVGQAEGIEVEPDDWKVTGLHVGLSDHAATELGFKRPVLSKVVVIIPTSAVSEIGNFITLDKAIENLKSLVECIRSCQPQK